MLKTPQLDVEQLLSVAANKFTASLSCRSIFGTEDVPDKDIVDSYCYNANILRFLPTSDTAFTVFFNHTNMLRRLAYSRAYHRDQRRLAVRIETLKTRLKDSEDLAEIYDLPLIRFKDYETTHEPLGACYDFTRLLTVPFRVVKEFFELARATSTKPLRFYDVDASPFATHADNADKK